MWKMILGLIFLLLIIEQVSHSSFNLPWLILFLGLLVATTLSALTEG